LEHTGYEVYAKKKCSLLKQALKKLEKMSYSRYWIERALEDAKGDVGLADYEVKGSYRMESSYGKFVSTVDAR